MEGLATPAGPGTAVPAPRMTRRAAAARRSTPARPSAQVVAHRLGARPMCISAGRSGCPRRGTGVHVGKSLYQLPQMSGRDDG